MLPALLASLLLTSHFSSAAFIYQGFHGSNLNLNGISAVDPSGILRLTNFTKQSFGHAFFPAPFDFTTPSSSFATSFVFAILPQYQDVRSHGLAFVLSPSVDPIGAQPSQYLGLFNLTNNGNRSNHIVAVELDTVQNLEYGDIDDNHVGIDIDSLRSAASASASYSTGTGVTENVSLISRQPMQVWVEYREMRLDVWLSPAGAAKPAAPLVSAIFNLSSFVVEKTYVGFSAANGGVTASNCVLGWSFALDGEAKELDISKLPSLPQGARRKPGSHVLSVALSVAIFLLFAVAALGIVLVFRRVRYAEVSEDWETEYGANRIPYKELYGATKGFRDENLLGAGGFGGVYRGTLRKSKRDVAVKRVSNDSRQGMREFVAEIVSVGRVRHRNLVQLLGYSRRQGVLLLVYEFMPNGSLDRYLYDRPPVVLDWGKRFRIVGGIAAGLLYLHEEWEQVVLHRDIKASNVLLDREFNGKLGDFGLARLYDREGDPHATHVVGSLGYIAPELSRTGIATTFSDVYAFGAFLLEVACGRRPIELRSWGVELVLVDWVLDFLKKGVIGEARDRRLGEEEVVAEEMELVLRLGLLCSHPVAMARPSMRQVVQYLAGDVPVPNMSEEDVNMFEAATPRMGVFGGESLAYPLSVTESELFSTGRRW